MPEWRRSRANAPVTDPGEVVKLTDDQELDMIFDRICFVCKTPLAVSVIHDEGTSFHRCDTCGFQWRND
jgi:hypothetical protein